MRDQTVPLLHFQQLYEKGRDPWGYASSAYEEQKYAATVAALPRPRYQSAFEVGCSIGVLTSLLADRCDDLLAVEPVTAAMEAARARNADRPHVRFDTMFVPGNWPNEEFDLIVLSEVLDYLGSTDLQELALRIAETLRPTGDLVLVHWVGKKRGGPSPTEASAVLIDACASFTRCVHQDRNADYRLDVLTRQP